MAQATHRSAADDGPPRVGAERRLSRLLAGLHVAGIAAFVLVMLGTVIWISAEHNTLAREASERTVRGGIASFRTKIETVVSDYSIWDEAYSAFVAGDGEWLYSNIGTGAAEIGALDVIVLADPASGTSFGWREGSPVEGETGLLPDAIIETALGLLDGPDAIGPASTFALIDGMPWAIAVTTIRPVGGPPAGLRPGEMPRQIHAQRVQGRVIDQIAANLMMDGLVLTDTPALPGDAQVSLPLADAAGATIAHVAWTPPRPGASILAKVAFPLVAAVTVIAVIAAVLARYSARSALRLEEALEAARAVDRIKTEFLWNVSHELRTPMNGIIGVAQLLAVDDLTSGQRELVGVLQASADAQLALINDLLDITRMESGNRHLDRDPFEPGATIRQIVELMRPVAARKGLPLGTEYVGLDGLSVLGDEGALRQIVTNLLGNAVKFTDQGRVDIACTVVRKAEEAELSLRVSDTGPGIAAKDQARIFERFVQVDASRTRTTEGTGLGLAISQGLAEMMGSRIEVESIEGDGATFSLRVYLPLAGVKAPESMRLVA
jgi:signal transduction histidine kinase